MCYAKPGPRCSHHAYKKLQKTIKAVNSSRKHGSAEHAEKMKELKTAYAEYAETPAGIEFLKKTYGEDSIEVQHFTQLRNNKLEQLKKQKPQANLNIDKPIREGRRDQPLEKGLLKVEESPLGSREHDDLPITESSVETLANSLGVKDSEKLQQQMREVFADNNVAYLTAHKNLRTDAKKYTHIIREYANNGEVAIVGVSKSYKLARVRERIAILQAESQWGEVDHGERIATLKNIVDEIEMSGGASTFIESPVQFVSKEKVPDYDGSSDPVYQRYMRNINQDFETVQMLEKTKQQYLSKVESGGIDPDPEILSRFDEKVSEGYLHIANSYSARNYYLTTVVFQNEMGKEDARQKTADEYQLKVFEKINNTAFSLQRV